MKKTLLIMMGLLFVSYAKPIKFNYSLAPTLGIIRDEDKSSAVYPDNKPKSNLFGISTAFGVEINDKHHIRAIGIKTFQKYRTIAGGGAGYEISLLNHEKVDLRLGAYVGYWQLNDVDFFHPNIDLFAPISFEEFYTVIPVTLEIGNKVPRFYVSSKLFAGTSVASATEMGLSLVFVKKN